MGGGGENKIRDFIVAKHISGAVDGEGLEKVGFPCLKIQSFERR